jgi:hypothetical protein
MTNSNSAIGRPARRVLLVVVALAGLGIAALRMMPASAADAVELPYHPPIGSHWIIDTETASNSQRPEGLQTSDIKTHAELTVDEKTADGFRISYVSRGASFEGNAPMLPLMQSAMKALENVTIHATTDLSGKPIRVDNLDEAKTAMHAMVGTMMTPFKDKPQVAAVMKQMMNQLIEVDATQAASAYLEEMPVLARAQNTGMKPGEIKRSSDSAANPLGGGALKSNTTFELTQADAATGKRVFVRTTTYDDASLKEMTQTVSRKLLAASGDPTKAEQIDKLVKSMVLSLDERATYEVEDGMTRKISEKSVTKASAMGHALSKTETRTVTVTRAP